VISAQTRCGQSNNGIQEETKMVKPTGGDGRPDRRERKKSSPNVVERAFGAVGDNQKKRDSASRTVEEAFKKGRKG
jgi:hypothetical protein